MSHEHCESKSIKKVKAAAPFGFASCLHCNQCVAKKIYGMPCCDCGSKK